VVAVKFRLRVDSVSYRVARLQVQVLPIPHLKGMRMDTLVEAYKENDLGNYTMVCRNQLCDRAINMETAHLEVYEAEEFDTYVFKCPHCDKILSINYDYKSEKETKFSWGAKI